MTSSPDRNRRADARRSRAAILDSAVRVLNADPDASLETIAGAAGVTRQTVYAHFPSREHLLLAVLDQLTEETVAAMDAAELNAGPAADSLLRLLDSAEQVSRRYPVLLQKISTIPVNQQANRDRHTPVADRLRRVIQRGQQAGEFDDQLPTTWLVAITINLAHAASEEQLAGRLSDKDAGEVLRTSLLRVLGAAAGDGSSQR